MRSNRRANPGAAKAFAAGAVPLACACSSSSPASTPLSRAPSSPRSCVPSGRPRSCPTAVSSPWRPVSSRGRSPLASPSRTSSTRRSPVERSRTSSTPPRASPPPPRPPFFHPTTLHPRYARALVNLSRCPPGGRLADPFCGTGGILLEAALCGLQARGADVSPAMVAGAAETLEEFNVKAELSVGDVGLLAHWEGVRAIATDPPYGRAASTQREPLPDLYRRFFAVAAEHARRGAAVAVIVPSSEMVDVGREFLHLEETHVLRVHRSLDRHFCVFS